MSARSRYGCSADVQSVYGRWHFGTHVDTGDPIGGDDSQRIRTDVSATLFLSAPEEYEEANCMLKTPTAVHSVKLPAGHMVLYPATSLHRVSPVTRGPGWASFFWVQSMDPWRW